MKEKEAYQLYTTMRESMGDEDFLNELVKALDSQEFIDDIEYIARMHGFEIECEDEE